MTSEIRANTIKNRVGLGTVSYTNTGIVVSGIVTANTVRLSDDNKIQLGDGQDIEVYHDGSYSYIQSQGTLFIDSAGDINFRNPNNGEYKAAFNNNGPCSLLHNGQVKFATTSTGINVTGSITGTGDFTLTDTATDSSAGPEFKLFRNSASPADADYLGQIKFAGESDTGVERNYAKITGKILDASNGTEDGILEFAHIKAGSQTITGRWRSDSLQLLNGTSLTVAGTSEFTGAATLGGDLIIPDYIKHLGDTNTMIGFPSNDSFSVTTNNVTRMTFTGNFIDLPDAGTFRFGGSQDLQIYHGSGGASNIVHSNTSQPLIISATGAGSIRFDTNSNERLRIDSNGRLKINHTSTSSKLADTWLSIYDANSDSSANDPAGISKNYAMISLHNYGTGNNGDAAGIGFGAGSGFNYVKGSIAFQRQGSYGTGDLVFLTNNDQDSTMVNNTDEKLRITRDSQIIFSDCDVSIGRDTALANYADGSTTRTQLAVVKDGGGAGSGYHEVAHFTAGTDTNDTGAIVRITQFNNDRGLYIKGGRGTSDQAKAIFGLRNSAAVDSDIMYFKQGGLIGINVSNPSQALHVAGTIINSTSVNSTGDQGIQMGNGHRLGFDQSGTRSWTMKANAGNLTFNSGDGNGAFDFNTTAHLKLPSGTTAQRVNTTGAIRYNSSLGNLEFYDGSSWKRVRLLESAPTSGLLAYWPFSTASRSGSTYNDVSGNNQHLTVNGTITDDTTETKFGGCIDFGTADGNHYLKSSSNSFTDIDASSGYSGVSISVWVKTTVTNNYQQWIISEGTVNSRWNYFVENATGPKWRSINGGDITMSGSMMTGDWHHLVVTWNSSNNLVSHYRDGNLTNTGTTNITPSFTGGYLLVGQHSSLTGNSGSYRWRGKMAHMRLYNRVLTSTEVSVLSQQW